MSIRRMCRGSVLVVGVALLVGCSPVATPAGPDAAAPPDVGPLRAQLVEAVTGDGSVAHVEALQRIADANGGNRASPGPGYDGSVDYVTQVLREAGFEVTTPSVTVEQDGTERQVRSVVAQTRTGDPSSVVLAGAHLDSVPEGPGANDNASGVGALLEIAQQLGGSPPVANAVRFGFWGAEELHLDGSTGYVDSLSRNERSALALYVNVDMAASPNAGYFVQGGAGDEESETGPPGSQVVGQTLLEEFSAAGAAAELVEFGDGSDHVPFVEAGVPTGAVFAGNEGEKSDEQAERWGGRADADYDPCYHAACDRVDGLDRVALDRFGDAIAGTVARMAEASDPVHRHSRRRGSG